MTGPVMPNFFIIGAARSGTSSLYEYMRQHPQIYFPELKEPMYFAFQQQKLSFQGPGDEAGINSKAVTDAAAYKALFRGVRNETSVGEASANYLYHSCVAQNIRAELPDAKLICILRNPVERAYSSYLYTLRDGRETERSFEAALAREEQRVADNWCDIWHYQRCGFYYRQLAHFYRQFPAEQIKVILQDDLKTRPGECLSELFAFLGVDSHFQPDVGLAYNQGGEPRNQLLNRLLTRPSRIKRILRPLTPQFLLRAYIEMKHKNLSRPELSPETHHMLLEGYREDLEQLQTLLSRDLSSWLAGPT